MPTISSHANVQQLAALMLAHGVRCCVLCPGSRNAPLSATLAALPGFECRRATDERSAGFAALGWAARDHAPVAVCVTSGSALLNLHPAVAEAFYRNVPLLVLSADRPASAIGQQEGQTLPQPGAFGSLVRAAVDLPEHDTLHANRLINEALLALTHRGGGPVHINIPLSEPLFGVEESPLPEPRRIERMVFESARYELGLETPDLPPHLQRRLVLFGQMPDWEDIPEPSDFAIIGEHLCNGDSLVQTRPDLILGPHPDASWSPDLLITMGGCVISKRLRALFRAHPPKEHWHVSVGGEVIDSFGCLTRVVEGDPRLFLQNLVSDAPEGDAEYAARWYQPVPEFPTDEYSGMAIVGRLMAAMSRLDDGSTLHLGNSSAVRYAQLFPLGQLVHVECNRGVNGIEGSVSTALGYAMADRERVNVLVIGDLSFFYDMNALWMPGTRGNMRILLLNNGTGGIFSTLPQCPAHESVHGPHGAQAQAWVESMGWRYMAVRGKDDIAPAVAALTAVGADRPLLVEAFTDAATDAALLREFYTKH